MTRVLIIEKRMTHYRVPMFEKLKARLSGQGIELLVGYGPCHASERSRNDAGSLDWAVDVPTRYLADGRICLQSFGKVARHCDLLIVTQENKLVSNLAHQFFPTPYKVALWGHGANLQGDPDSWQEKWKRFVSRRADWWFAYTEFTLPLLERAGFDMRRVTVLGNSIDTDELSQLCRQSEADGQADIRTKLGLSPGAFTGLYLASFSPDKRLDFLFDAATEIRRRIPSFELIVAGSGPEQARVDSFCQQHSWCHSWGQARGRLKSDLLVASDVVLNPGMVGLGILDSFVAGRPMITTRGARHSPEIAYLDNGVNGLMTDQSVSAYADAVCHLYMEHDIYDRMSKNCLQSARTFSVDEMARRFATGIGNCLQS